MRIPLAKPDIAASDIEAVVGVLQTPSLSRGKAQLEFEAALAGRVSATHGVAVSSGTAGLHLAIRACGVGADDEVITTPFSFVASANAILYERAIPVFADIDPVTLNIDPDRVEAAITPRTRAILAVHTFGRPADMERLLAIAGRRGLPVIEDACEALGAETSGRAAGSLGACGVFGFYPNKPITTGEGGMIVTSDAAIAAMCRSLRNHGRDDGAASMDHDRLGYNYRLSEMACALGVAQLARLDSMLDRRAQVAKNYDERLRTEPGLVLPALAHAGGRTSWFVYVVRLSQEFTRDDRDGIAAGLQERGIGCGRYFAALHTQPHIARVSGTARGDFPNTEAASDRTLALPFFPSIEAHEIDEVASALSSLVRARRGLRR